MQFEGTEISKATWPRRTQFREFKGNVAHSNYDGFMFDRNINANNTFTCDRQLALPASRILLIRTARRWCRCSRISPPTRTAMAASGAVASCTCSGT